MSLCNFKAKKRFTYRFADQYILDIFKENVDYVINIDEDAFVCNQNALYSLLDYVIDNKVVNCGVRDGGALTLRGFHPLVTNPFFNIIDVRKIRKEFDIDIIQRTPCDHSDYKTMIPKDLHYYYSFEDNEPFNKIFIWITLNFKTLFLDVQVHKDGFSIIVLNHKKEPFLLHSWYSRYYGKDRNHTARINALFNEAQSEGNHQINHLFNIKHYLQSIFIEPISYLLSSIQTI
jgi:hypothetical protein